MTRQAAVEQRHTRGMREMLQGDSGGGGGGGTNNQLGRRAGRMN